MRATGIVRRVDDLGRIVIPKETRKTFGINEGTPLEIFVSDSMICLRKYDMREPYLEMLSQMKENVMCDADIGNRSEVLEKLDEVIATLGGEVTE